MWFCFILSVLEAINEDSPTVPTLLTDYILKGTNKQKRKKERKKERKKATKQA
jgi:hypothetical protein